MKLLTYDPTQSIIGIGILRSVGVGDCSDVPQRVILKGRASSVGAVDGKNVAVEVVLKFGESQGKILQTRKLFIPFQQITDSFNALRSLPAVGKIEYIN